MARTLCSSAEAWIWDRNQQRHKNVAVRKLATYPASPGERVSCWGHGTQKQEDQGFPRLCRCSISGEKVGIWSEAYRPDVVRVRCVAGASKFDAES
jgi:hypothetical protein